MTHGSLYSGIGGWLLAARWAEIENIFTVEIDDFCNNVLKKHFDVEQHRDIKEFNGEKYHGTIDILSTSDPCQPFSFAGKRGGTTDDRFLWPETIRVIREIKPSYVVFENVPGFISMAFETVASDLEAEGYTVESFVIPACAVGAWHRRDRLWIIANNEKLKRSNRCPKKERKYKTSQIQNRRLYGTVPNTGLLRQAKHEEQTMGVEQCCEITDVPDSSSKGLQGSEKTGNNSKDGQEPGNEHLTGCDRGREHWAVEPELGRVVSRLPNRVDRLKSLGNSIVPQIAYIIFEAIKQYSYDTGSKTFHGITCRNSYRQYEAPGL